MPPTLANPGNIVVPLSMIIDQLQGKLTSVEIDALLAAVVSGQKQQVNPGDLITAELMNQILNDLADLNLRVATLEAGQPSRGQGVVIVYPTILTVLRVGDPLVIQGQNLLANSTVLIEQTSIGGIIGSIDNTQLTIASIPSIDVPGGLPEAGRQVRLTVTNGAGSGTSVFVLKPFQLVHPIGSMVIAQSSGPPAGTTFAAGGDYDYVFMITADTKPDTTFRVEANIGHGSWTATPSQSEIFIPAAIDAQTPTIATIAVRVHIAGTAQNGDTGQLFVRLTAKTDSTFIWRSTPDIPIAVNAQAPPTRKLSLTLSGSAGQAAIRTNPDNTKTALIGAVGGTGGVGQLDFTITRVDGNPLDSGLYTVDLTKLGQFVGDTTPAKWQASIAGQQGNQVTLGGASNILSIQVTAAAGAPNATMILELSKSTDSSISGHGEFPVERRQ